ncbi:FAD-dependent oxidoreductase [Nonlabens marinus]|uniref:2-polyprenyl-6-methoxyphenol hydroxylase and related FAD-dependent oxidoreductases n=1 Tax=Nonlabens marinus S1-08 TaxID=1454201 RepID=W8VR21_9FLAO|nr:NAD(P)/FAD-dependent oxidoreductase [Nonlabens marinus]BAO56039.1 2-polyprenyl-6-methoxyphenol hydroxylase and related FAD-dependent oxidoreductases [Nonlabens marinus S1-08]
MGELQPKKHQGSWSMCPKCQGRGKKSQRIRKKAKLRYQQALIDFKKSNGATEIPTPPKGHLTTCSHCSGSGLLPDEKAPEADTERYPHVAIIGGGIGGTALAVACLHRGIPFTLFERDDSFDARSQGYGLTLQQASKAMDGFGITSLKDGVVSTRHVVHHTDGTILGEWGLRKWMESNETSEAKRTNIHIARQSLRLALLQQLKESQSIRWGHQLVALHTGSDSIDLSFQFNGTLKKIKAGMVVGADGIRSAVRDFVLDTKAPLQYLDCIVILGICPLSRLGDFDSELLDSATVFQTANGQERIYMMPYNKDSIMWQLSYPLTEKEAKALSSQGSFSLKEEAHRITSSWHHPIPQIIEATAVKQVSGYPVYDRELLQLEHLKNCGAVTLLGDAAHPMSPFKGQGANQALLDALSLAREITKGCQPGSSKKSDDLRKHVLQPFESEMMKRSARKVKDSAAAAQFLHSDIVLQEADAPRGRMLK